MGLHVGVNLEAGTPKTDPVFSSRSADFSFVGCPRPGFGTHEWISFLHTQVLGGRPVLHLNAEETSVKRTPGCREGERQSDELADCGAWHALSYNMS